MLDLQFIISFYNLFFNSILSIMAVVLFDAASRAKLYPLTYTKAVAELRFGIFSIQERWQQLLQDDIFIETEPYLQSLYSSFAEGVHTWINACALPSADLVDKIKKAQQGDVYEDENGIIACKGWGKNITDALENAAMNFITINKVNWLHYPHQILHWNEVFIQLDFNFITKNKTSQPLSFTNRCVHQKNIFIEEGASVEFSIINAEKGPVYIGKNATVMEGCLLKGPLVIGENAVVKMGSKLYGATAIGLHCTVGGELKNVVMQSHSNKAHDGYLGDSIIGEWCNLGAGASNSNVKNTAGDILLWNGFDNDYINVGNKFGVVMGDYTRVAINSSINTGSVYGVSCNVFGTGLLPARLHNFCWGVNGEKYQFSKAIQHIKQWKNFKQQKITDEEEYVLKYIFDNFINR